MVARYLELRRFSINQSVYSFKEQNKKVRGALPKADSDWDDLGAVPSAAV